MPWQGIRVPLYSTRWSTLLGDPVGRHVTRLCALVLLRSSPALRGRAISRSITAMSSVMSQSLALFLCREGGTVYGIPAIDNLAPITAVVTKGDFDTVVP